MKRITVSATDLKNNISEVLNTVYFNKTTAVIERHNKPIAFIVPVNKPDRDQIAAILKKTFGAAPDFPDVVADRHFRKREIAL